MAYRLRLYAPTTGVSYIRVATTSGSLLANAVPAGTGTPCFDEDEIPVSIRLTPYLEDGYQVSQWVVNVDGAVSYATGSTYTFSYSASSTASNVQIRLEVEALPTYYATLQFDANGGSGAPASVSGSAQSQYVPIMVPYGQPTRSGYTFLGWSTSPTATAPSYYPGTTYNWYGYSYNAPIGYTSTLYAVWTEDTGGAYISNGTIFTNHYIPYIYTSSGWVKATPYIYTSTGWKKGL